MVLILILGFLFSQEPDSLGMEQILPYAEEAYEKGPGRALAIEAEGLRSSRSLTGGRFTELSLEAIPEVSAKNGDRGEHNLSIAAEMSLANMSRMKKDALTAMASITHETSRNERLQFILQVQAAYSESFLAQTLSSHIRELHQSALELESRLEKQVQQKLATRSEWFAQQALTGEYAAEVREMEGRVQAAHATLERLLDRKLVLRFPQPLTVPATDDDPFSELRQNKDLSPESRLSLAMAHSARSEAQLAAGANAPSLAPNLNFRDEPNGDRWLSLGVKLSFSLRPKRDDVWRKHQSRAVAWEARARWQAATFELQLASRSARYQRNRERAETFAVEVLTPLKEQAELYAKAARAGHVEHRFRLQAQADLHEAEHHYLLLVHGLWADRAEARIWEQIISKGASS